MDIATILLQASSGSNQPALIFLLVAIILLIYFASYKKERIGNWSHLFAHVQHDPEIFYDQVEAFLKEHEVPDFESKRITLSQDGPISLQRLYLEISRGDYVYHICAAPWGTDFFFSWWLNFRMNNFSVLLTRIPIIGAIITGNNEQAYYKLDTDTMFRTSVQEAVLAAIDRMTESKGLRGLTELERKPDLKSIFKVRMERP